MSAEDFFTTKIGQHKCSLELFQLVDKHLQTLTLTPAQTFCRF